MLFGSANSFKSYCVHMKSPRTYIETSRQRDGNFLGLFCLLRHTNHEHLPKGENFGFFFTHTITIFSLFTYSVCDEKVKMWCVLDYLLDILQTAVLRFRLSQQYIEIKKCFQSIFPNIYPSVESRVIGWYFSGKLLSVIGVGSVIIIPVFHCSWK